jgi:hypothetical protein
VILRYYPGIRLEGPRKTTKILSQDSMSSDRDMNPGPLEYEARVLTTRHSSQEPIYMRRPSHVLSANSKPRRQRARDLKPCSLKSLSLITRIGRAVVSRRPVTAEARVRAWVNPGSGQSGTGTGFSPSSTVFPCQYIPPSLSKLISSGKCVIC